MKTLRLIELFAGYGSQAMAIKRLNIPFETYRVVEFDKYAIRSYNAVHDTDFPAMDIRDVKAEDLGIVETDKYNYLLTYSFPCTDLSLAGKRQGMSRDSGTRSGLLWEVERILKEAQELRSLPQFLLMENVPQVHGESNIKDFGDWISFLDSLGYVSKWQDLNAKDYGVAQNRERCFMVSYLDRSLMFAFPEKIMLTKKAKDYLEDSVDDKYYLKSDKAKELISKLIVSTEDPDIISIKANTGDGFYQLENGGLVDLSYPESASRRGRAQSLPRLCPTLQTSGEISKVDKILRVVDLSTTDPEILDRSNTIQTAQRGLSNRNKKETGVLEASTKTRAFLNYKRIDSPREEIAKTICSRDNSFGGANQTQNGVIEKFIVEERTDEGLRTFGNALSGALRTTRSGGDKRAIEIRKCLKVGEMDLKHELSSRVDSAEGISPTVTTNKAFVPNFIIEYKIRKLTPLECFRLMDVSDEDARKMLAVNSETQCYKQAGNSIVVAVLEKIFFNMFCGGSDQVKSQIDIFDIL